MKNVITYKAFVGLSEDEQFFYDPRYKSYKTKKVRSYETCDLGHSHFMGWVEESTPVGEPYMYVRDNSLIRQTAKLIQPKIIEAINQSNVLTQRILSS